MLVGSTSQMMAAEGAARETDNPAYWKQAQADLAKLGDGFLIWETYRTGVWRIWTCKLDGSGSKQLSADEPTKDHQCPKISPDGKTVVYLSFPKAPTKGDGGPDAKGEKVPVHQVNADGSNDHIILPDARQYTGWNRAVSWINNQELAYIGGDGNTYQFNLKTQESKLLFKRLHVDAPSWLPNSKKTFAVWSFNTFSPFDEKLQVVRPIPHMGGCQPYFTQDGDWGFWESYCGGPVGIAHLNSWVYACDRSLVTVVAEKSSIPPPFNYLYFPMISSDKRLLAFAAKDHEFPGGYSAADWDIFVLPLNPKTLQAASDHAIRYTFEPGCDRFPDVWQAPLPLGCHSGKVPFTPEIKPPAGPGWGLDFGDSSNSLTTGSSATGTAGTHTYTKPGLYTVSATRGKEVLYGQVYVQAAQPPKALRAILKDPKELVVIFDEPVNSKGASVSLKSQGKIAKSELGEDGRVLHVFLAQPAKGVDTLILEGITDLAQQPNRLAKTELPFDIRIWPSTQDGLVFLWQNGNKPNLLKDPVKGNLSCTIVAKGRAWYDRNWDMVAGGGGFQVQGLSEVFAKAIQKSKAFTIELTVGPPQPDGKPHGLLSYGLVEKNNKLILRNHDQELELTPMYGYLALTYQSGTISVYRAENLSFASTGIAGHVAKNVLTTDKFPLDLNTLASAPLLIGNNYQGEAFNGLVVSSLALYDRPLSVEELSMNYRGRMAIDQAVTPIDTFNAGGGLKEASKTPVLKEIAPYTRALVLNEYESNDHKPIRVAHWAIMDGQYERIAQLSPKGGDINMNSLEPLSANPQLVGEYVSDTLTNNPDVPTYFCPSSRRFARGGSWDWHVVGPFELDSAKALETPTDVEKGPNPNKTFTPAAGQQWQVINLIERYRNYPDGYIDLNDVYAGKTGNCAYAHMFLSSPSDRPALVTVEFAGGAKVWVNGQVVVSAQSDRAPFRAQKREPITLKKGWNEILVKTTKSSAGWGFLCDILNAEGREMPEVGLSVDGEKVGNK